MADQCDRCGSLAINYHHHGRKHLHSLNLCDVCYWRKEAEESQEEFDRLTKENEGLRKSDVSQGSGDLEIVRIDGDPTGRTMPDSITIRSECATVTYENAEQLKAERDRLRDAIRKARNHQTEMGGSFTQWFNEVQNILGKALNK